MMKVLFLTNIFLCLFIASLAQIPKHITDNLNQYRKVHKNSFLYLHHDKSIYTNNEKIWFSVYLFKTPNTLNEHKVLNVSLVNESTKGVVLSEKFFIADGLSSGFLLLPDSIAPGKYQLLANTNVLDHSRQPIAVFSSPIKVLNISQHTFTSSFTLIDSAFKNGVIRAKIDISGLDPNRKTKIAITQQPGTKHSKAIIMNGKQALLTINQDELSEHPSVVKVRVDVDGEIQYHEAKLPNNSNNEVDVKFYPEGGSLVTGLKSRVGFETKTSDGRPISLNGVLMKNDQPISEVSTNSLGMGTFSIQPETNEKYTLSLNPGKLIKKELKIKLPEHSADKKMVIELEKAVVNDSLKFSISSTEEKAILIMLHNLDGEYILLKSQLGKSLKTLSLPLNTLSKGITKLTIMDESANPLIERLFFAHYDQHFLVPRVAAFKEFYNKGDSVKMKIQLKDPSGNPSEGIVSVSVVQSNRISATMTDIENYYYLNRCIADLPISNSMNGLADVDYLEDVLLIKGWVNFTKPLSESITDSLSWNILQIEKGLVTRKNKPLNKPLNLVSFGGIKPSVITTNEAGEFNIQDSDLMVEQNKKLFFMVDGNKDDYNIRIEDPLLNISKTLAERTRPTIFESLSNEEEGKILRSLQNVFVLKEVQITSKQSNINAYGEKGENACGDYVEIHHDYLNYERTPPERRRKPIVGRRYLKRTDLEVPFFRVDPVIYIGCLTEQERKSIAIKGINSGKEYYMAVQADDSPAYQSSTVYWQSGLVVGSSGELELSFKAGDISDKFLVTVQGISSRGIVNAKNSFEIK
ncbi:MAG: hypothetical protein ACQUHE_03670 [Bacteroidia bacterium]